MSHHPPKKYIVYWIAKCPNKTYNDPYRARMKSFSDLKKSMDFKKKLDVCQNDKTLHQEREIFHVSSVYGTEFI